MFKTHKQNVKYKLCMTPFPVPQPYTLLPSIQAFELRKLRVNFHAAGEK